MLQQEDISHMNNKKIIESIKDELAKAMDKYPSWPTDPCHALIIIGEEFGELTKDVLQLSYEPHKTSLERLRKEAIQTAAMALRFMASIDRYEFTPGVQHYQHICDIFE